MSGAPSREAGTRGDLAWQLIDSDEKLRSFALELADEKEYALDTEFHHEKTYYPRLALCQIATRSTIALIDPLACDIRALKQVIAGNGILVGHALGADLSIMARDVGALPIRVFDTQIAGGFCGLGVASLANLLAKTSKLRIDKGSQLTDWTVRPLSERDARYAAGDVAYLLDAKQWLEDKLTTSGRLAWARAENAELAAQRWETLDAKKAWWKIKGSRSMRGNKRGIAQEVAEWRERTARRLDKPARFIMSELTIMSVVAQPPTSIKELLARRGAEGLKGRAQEVMDAIERGMALDDDALVRPLAYHDDNALAGAVGMLSAYVSQQAHQLGVDKGALATNADLIAFVNGRASRLDNGWRHDALGRDMAALKAGRATLGLGDGGRSLLLFHETPELFHETPDPTPDPEKS